MWKVFLFLNHFPLIIDLSLSKQIYSCTEYRPELEFQSFKFTALALRSAGGLLVTVLCVCQSAVCSQGQMLAALADGLPCCRLRGIAKLGVALSVSP